jgi:lipopolysaccharide/colanic/teichoic acid biosynthesis glycosyltransferase
MLFFQNFKSLLSINNSKSTETENGILSEKAFLRILERERARSDRYGNIFSLIIFEASNSNGHKPKVLIPIDILINRLRPTDEVGWYNKARLGIILPSTPYEGAVKLANDICIQIQNRTRKSPAFEVLIYPADRLDKVDRKSQNHFLKNDECVLSGFGETQTQTVDVGDCKRLAENSNLLFTQELPMWKRAIDIFGSLFGLLVLSPLLLTLAVLIKIVSPGPAFFSQKRIGYLGRPFTMFKFRTMKMNADTAPHENHVSDLIQNGKPLIKMDGRDPRIFPLGKFLRLTGLDELPQLVNVLRGEMSLVGPRPELPSALQYCEPWQTRRFETKPGLSGLWQVSGKTKTTFTEMMRLDISYVKKRSFWLDVLILLKTLPTILAEARR